MIGNAETTRFFIFSCDSCGAELETAEPNFGDALEYMKRLGWYSELDEGGLWEHFCDECPPVESLIREGGQFPIP